MDGSFAWQYWKEIVLFLLAIYGAALSTYNLIQAGRKDRRSIKVELLSVIPVSGGMQMGHTYVEVRATNTGHRVVRIKHLTIELETGHRLYLMQGGPMPNTELPATLSDGQTASAYMAYQDVAATLLKRKLLSDTKIIPVCEDSAGGVHKGKGWTINPSEFAKVGAS